MTDYDALSLAHDEAWDAAIAAEDEGRPLDEIVALWAYLDRLMTPDELARYVEQTTERCEWDTDSPAILTWLRENAV